jgi:hypothetical protein
LRAIVLCQRTDVSYDTIGRSIEVECLAAKCPSRRLVAFCPRDDEVPVSIVCDQIGELLPFVLCRIDRVADKVRSADLLAVPAIDLERDPLVLPPGHDVAAVRQRRE